MRPVFRRAEQIIFFLTFFIITACASRQTMTVNLSGVILYEEYDTGEVRIMVFEDETYSPQPFGRMKLQTPGEMKAQTVISRPGTFEISAEIGYVGNSVPDILLLAYLYDGDFGAENSIAGAFGVLTAEDHTGIEVSLITDYFPVLM